MKVKPIKRLGQNFLIDENVLAQIIDAANLSSNDIVLEIGPGTGILTLELARRAKKVIAVEKDKKMCEALKDILTARNVENVEIIHGDILKISNLEFLISNQIRNSNFKIDSKFEIQDYKIVANIPYYLTSPLIRKFLEIEYKPELMVLMVQKEVAQRICTAPPNMSLLSVAVQFYAQPKIISNVSKNAFYPVPKIDSAILRIKPQISNVGRRTSHIDTKRFFGLVKAGFANKRKFLINNLSRELKIENCKLKIIFDQIKIDQTSRAEELSVDNWIELSTILTNKNLL